MAGEQMPFQKKSGIIPVGSKKRCSKKCLKKYMTPDMQEYQGRTFAEKVDYCVSAHYVCCKPGSGNDDSQKIDVREDCRKKVSAQEKQ